MLTSRSIIVRFSSLIVLTALALAGCSSQSVSAESTTSTTSSTSLASSVTSVTSSSSSSSTTVSSSTESSGTEEVEVADMDIQAIAQNDYSSIAGTWQNANGDTMVFDENGLVGESQIQSDSARFDLLEGGVVLSAGVAGTVGGYGIVMVPKGISIPEANLYETTDTSDISQERMFAGQKFILDANGISNLVFYRISETE